MSGAEVSALWRAPGITVVLESEVTPVEAWNLASRLDYVLTLTGKLEGWQAIRRETAATLERLRKERTRKGLWTDEEGRQDRLLVTFLETTGQFVQAFSARRVFKDWCREVLRLLASSGCAETGAYSCT